MFFDPSQVESIKETMGLYFYHDHLKDQMATREGGVNRSL
jgi:uncharacterized protein (DUF2164 family)